MRRAAGDGPPWRAARRQSRSSRRLESYYSLRGARSGSKRVREGVWRQPRWIPAPRSHANQLTLHCHSPGAWKRAMQWAEGRRADVMAAGLVGVLGAGESCCCGRPCWVVGGQDARWKW